MKNNCQEKEFEEKYSSSVDNIYRAMLAPLNISRSRYSSVMTKELFADKYLGVDTILKLQNGTRLSIQEKLRNAKVFNTYSPALSIELMDNEETNETGEWFNSIPRLLFIGYASTLKNNILEWYLINTANLKLIFKDVDLEELKEKYMQKNVPPKSATFLAIPIQDIRKAVIVCSNYISI